jgi:hypothetical protein
MRDGFIVRLPIKSLVVFDWAVAGVRAVAAIEQRLSDVIQIT